MYWNIKINIIEIRKSCIKIVFNPKNKFTLAEFSYKYYRLFFPVIKKLFQEEFIESIHNSIL